MSRFRLYKPDRRSEVTGKVVSGVTPRDIAAMGNMFQAGILQRNSRFNADLDTLRPRVIEEGPEFVIARAHETSSGKEVTISLADVRAVQLAKGAMHAGAKLMMRWLGIDRLDKVILAGAFGGYIDKESAMILGLVPDCELEKVYAM